MLDFDVLNREYGDKLLRKASMMCQGNHTFAEEAVQETFTAAWKNQEQFTGGNVHAWLTTILRNKIIDARRPNRRNSFLHNSIQLNDDGGLKEDFKALTFTDPEPGKPDVMEAVEKAIETLPQEYVPICKLRLLEEMQQKEVAEKLNLPLGTVQSRMFRIAPRLRKVVEQFLLMAQS